MAIVPVGNKKKQVNQGFFQNENLMSNILFSKVAQGLGALVDNDKKPPQQQKPGGDLQSAMSGGGLDHGSMANQLEGKGDPNGGNMPSGNSITPNNPEQNGQQQLSPFLQPPQQDASQQSQNPLMDQMNKIEQMLQGSGFGFDIQQGSSGKYTLQLQPVQGASMSRDNYKRILEGLRGLGFNPSHVKLPAEDPSNAPVYMEYTLGGEDQKVMKKGK